MLDSSRLRGDAGTLVPVLLKLVEEVLGMRFKSLAIALAATLLAAHAASAQEHHPWMGTLYVGYAKIFESDNTSRYGVPGGGVALHGGAYRMLEPTLGLGLEAGYQHYGTQAYAIPGEEGDAGFSSVHLTLQALAQGASEGTRPFGTIGAGWYSLRTTTSGLLTLSDGTPIPGNHFENKRNDSRFGANIGVGVQFRASKTSSLRIGVEARGHMIIQGWPEANGGTGTLEAGTLAAGIHFK
jgi:opacity protein-like surface antigen